jgi:lipopolysaccharide/colanic/teichoic acid biosynthesis glycosyltransferase
VTNQSINSNSVPVTASTLPKGLTLGQRFQKRALDVVVSLVGLLITFPLIAIGWVLATISTRNNGFFVHHRIGRYGRKFPMVKLRSMREVPGVTTTNTAGNDVRITKVGKWLRRLKIDELPQLANVLVGQMSLVGPRPDVEGYTDQLEGDDRVLLTIRPGITGPASLAYRHEETILEKAADPEYVNDNVLWPNKVKINCDYVRNWSFVSDVRYIWQTVFGYPGTIDPDKAIASPHFAVTRKPEMEKAAKS